MSGRARACAFSFMRMRAGSRGEEFLGWLRILRPYYVSVLCASSQYLFRLRVRPRLPRFAVPALLVYIDAQTQNVLGATMFKYLKQVLAPSAFEPELPPELLQTIQIATARKGSFVSAGSNVSVPEFDPLIASAFELADMLDAGAITSVEIVEAYLAQIEQHNRRGRQLRALISVAPRHELVRIARRLDDERSRGKRRGPLHGIPIVLKDNIMTEASLGMDTTVGRFNNIYSSMVLHLT